jgi:hypothetical protein
MNERPTTRPVCIKCGDVHPKGTCHNKAGKPCGFNLADGAVVCHKHGGSAPQVKAKAEKRRQETRAREAVATYGLPVEIDPGTALLEEVSRSAGHVRWLRDVVQELDADALVWGEKTTSHQAGHSVEGPVDVTTNVSAAGVNVWLELYLKERDHLRKVCTDALKAGIAERQVQLAEQAGERAGQWLRASLEVLGLSDADMRRVMARGVANLHLLEGGAA